MTMPINPGLVMPAGMNVNGGLAAAMEQAMGETIRKVVREEIDAAIDAKFGDIFELLSILAEHPLMRKLADGK